MSPIRAENRARYPDDWADISLAVREAADWQCECRGECGTHLEGCGWSQGDRVAGRRGEYSVVLTVAHLDHQPENCDRANLKAMCQPCHLRYDAAHHAATAAATRARRATEGMDPLPGLDGGAA